MFNPIFEPTLNPSHQAEINVLIQCLSESITPNSIRHYAYRIGSGCFHVLKLDDQLEVTLTEGCVDIPDKENCLDYISVGHLQVSVMDSIDITYLIAAIVNHFKSLNANLTYSLEGVAMKPLLALQYEKKASYLSPMGIVITNSQLENAANEIILRAKNHFGSEQVIANLTVYRHDGYEFLSCDFGVNNHKDLGMSITIAATNNYEFRDCNEPEVIDMTEAFHLSELIIFGLNAHVTIGRHKKK